MRRVNNAEEINNPTMTPKPIKNPFASPYFSVKMKNQETKTQKAIPISKIFPIKLSEIPLLSLPLRSNILCK